MAQHHSSLRDLPSITTLLDTQPLRSAAAEYGLQAATTAARVAVENLRQQILSNERGAEIPAAEELASRIAAEVTLRESNALKPVINATGILLHTGLGRAPLAENAVQAAAEAAAGYCNVELDLQSGQRTTRSQTVTGLLQELTGAEAAHVVNNNAAATALALAALASGREVIVSHGELIEIGGGFRLPDVIETFGARLRPVGTTNKTRVSDYERAISDQTGALLVVHPSNYAITGFTQSPPLEELARLAARHQIPLVHDIGSGALIDFQQFGCRSEPVAGESIAAGADMVLFSGDKLLGGPQAGIIIGRHTWMEPIHTHPLNRTMRVDKITLAALRETLKLYRTPAQALEEIPLLRMLSTPIEKLRSRGDQIVQQLHGQIDGWEIASRADEAFVGGGSTAQQAIPSWCAAITTAEVNVGQVAQQMRIGTPSVVPRVQQDELILNLHGVFSSQLQSVVDTVLRSYRLLCGSSN